jgi:hypothetical protein
MSAIELYNAPQSTCSQKVRLTLAERSRGGVPFDADADDPSVQVDDRRCVQARHGDRESVITDGH